MMKFVLGLAAALIFGTIGMGTTGALAQGGAQSTVETGSNATDAKGAGMGKTSGDKMSGDKMKSKGSSMKSKKKK